MILKTILLVDDSKTFIEVLSYALKNKFLNVITAFNVEEAIDNIKKIKFDVIISDYDMGSDNGLTILKFLKNNNYNSKFILLTGNSNVELKENTEKLNGIFLDKGDLNLVKSLLLEINSNC